MLCMYIAHLKTFSFSLSSLLYKVEKFGRIDILINNASALWWQRKQQSVTALCCFFRPKLGAYPQDRRHTDEQV